MNNKTTFILTKGIHPSHVTTKIQTLTGEEIKLTAAVSYYWTGKEQCWVIDVWGRIGNSNPIYTNRTFNKNEGPDRVRQGLLAHITTGQLLWFRQMALNYFQK
jgi:hypothetical protein